MATYIVRAPNNHQVKVQCKLGTKEFNHGDYMYDDKLAELFPTIFHKISHDDPFANENGEVPAPEVVEAIVEVVEAGETVPETEEVEAPATEEVAEGEVEGEEVESEEEKIAASTGEPMKKRGPKPKGK